MIEFILNKYGRTMLTRDQGAVVRSELEKLLSGGMKVELIFDGVHAFTPSFVDELLGKTLLAIGKKRFRELIKLTASSDEVRHLVNLVLSNRSASITRDAVPPATPKP